MKGLRKKPGILLPMMVIIILCCVFHYNKCESIADDWGKVNKTKLDSRYTMHYWHRSENGAFGEGRVVIKDGTGKVILERILESPYAGIDFLGKYKNKYYFQRYCNSYREGLYVFDPEEENKQIRLVKKTDKGFFSVIGRPAYLDVKRINNYTYCYSGRLHNYTTKIYIYDFDTNKLKKLDDHIYAAKTYKGKCYYAKKIKKNLIKIYRCEPDGSRKKCVKKIKQKSILCIDSMSSKYVNVIYGRDWKSKKIKFR